MIFRLLIIHDHDRMSSISRVIHRATWDYFTSHLPDRFSRSPQLVKEAIMTDINDLVQEFQTTSSDVGASFFAMRCLLKILQECFRVRFNIISVFATDADKNLQESAKPGHSSAKSGLLNRIRSINDDRIRTKYNDRIRANLMIQLDKYQKMFDQSFFKSNDLNDMLKFLSGVAVQKHLSMQGMSDLYRIKPDLLERLIKSTIMVEQLHPYPYSRYVLDDYLSRFLQDPDRSKLYYCDPMLQHISICRRFLSLLDGSSAFDLQL